MNVVVAKGDVISAYGLGMDALWNGLMSGKTAIRSTDMFAERGFVSNQAALIPDLQIEPGESRVMAMLRKLLSPLVGKFDIHTPVILATTVGEIEYLERGILEQNVTKSFDSQPGHLLRQVKKLLGVHSPKWIISSACASSSAALSFAAAMVQSGTVSAVLLIAVDTISEFVYSGFSTLNSLSETPARPFDAEHCGLTLGEAAAWMLVTPENHPAVSDPLMTILGWGSTTDAVHMTAPDRNAGGLTTAIRLACEMAGCKPSDLNLVAAHGTATLHNDSMEMLALRNTIDKPIPTFSVKGGVGHTLGSAGLLQILVAARAMKERCVPPTVGLTTPNTDSTGWVLSSPVPISDSPIALSISSGFGGVNTAVIFSRSSQLRKSEKSPVAVPSAVESVAWVFNKKLGSKGIHGTRREHGLPSTQEEMAKFIGRPVKYFSRMTVDAKHSLIAAKLALEASNWRDPANRRIGILAGEFHPTWHANDKYFRDYVANGRSISRASLFVYTLPTSVLGEVALALGLTGPTLFIEANSNPLKSLLLQARRMVDSGEADGILVLWNYVSAVCFAVGNNGNCIEISEADHGLHPSDLAKQFNEVEFFK